MSSKKKCSTLFESASKSPILTSIPVITTAIVSIILIILSIMQAFPINSNPINDTYEENWAKTCEIDLIEYLTPFNIHYGSSTKGCQWRPRNTIFRSIVVSLCLLNAIAALVAIFTQRFLLVKKAWPVFYWNFWMGFVMMFVVFILDCDGINTGLNACWNEFSIEAFNGLSLVRVGEIDDTGIVTEVTDYDCLITPFVYTACLDLLVSLMLFCSYKVSSYYIVDETQRKASIAGSPTKSSKQTPNNKGQSTDQTNVVMGNTNNNNNTKKKEDSPDPFAQYQGGYEVDNNRPSAPTEVNTGSAYGDTMSAYDE